MYICTDEAELVAAGDEDDDTLAIGDTLPRFPSRGLVNKNGLLLLWQSVVKGFFDKVVLGAGFGEHTKGLLLDSGTVFFSRLPESDC